MSEHTPEFNRDFEVLDFETLEEPWNNYDFADGTRMRGKLILTRIQRVNRAAPLSFTIQPLLTITSDPVHRGPPSPLTLEEISGQIQVQRMPVRITTSNEHWNIYIIRNLHQRMRARMIVSDIFRVTNRYDQFGEPAYIVQTGTIITPLEDAGPLTQ